MEPMLAVLVGVLMASSVYLMLSRNFVQFIFGLTLLSHAANMLIFASGGLTRGATPLIEPDLSAPAGALANALPQAMVLTAIVISFSVLAFALVLAFRTYQRLATVDVDAMRVAEPRQEAIEEGDLG